MMGEGRAVGTDRSGRGHSVVTKCSTTAHMIRPLGRLASISLWQIVVRRGGDGLAACCPPRAPGAGPRQESWFADNDFWHPVSLSTRCFRASQGTIGAAATEGGPDHQHPQTQEARWGCRALAV